MALKTLKPIVDSSDTQAGAVFQWFIQGLIILSLVTFSIGTLPGLSGQTKNVLMYMEIAVILIFSAEYALRLAVADRKSEYVFSFYGLIDLIAILPFYISRAAALIFLGLDVGNVDLRAVRVFRLLAMLRILKLGRYDAAIRRFRKAFSMMKEEFLLFALTTFIILFIASVGMYYFESNHSEDKFKSIPHSLWWSVVTLTTVGYGDTVPESSGGRIFAGLLILLGVGIVAVPAGLLASALSVVRRQEAAEKEETPED